MNRQLSALMLVVIAFSFTNNEAKAQSQRVDPKALPAADFYHHRLKIQVVNENPEITNTMRAPEPRKVLIIQTPQQAPQQVQYIIAPSASGPGLPPGAVDLSGPPQSGFQSNMPSNPNANSKRESLPSGQSTGGLSGKQLLSGRMMPPRGGQQPMAIAPASATGSAAPTRAMEYKPYNNGSGTSSGSGSKATATVSARLERGSLIGKAK